ncbi:MAG: precorrin-6y C5,15-methyltransferase (decarboxylating) subunit CbiE [Methylococcales bacterium]|nr:precorrin-6y C5,15-methyltransferase (decarboxylating) subunit CbiE [Methylococcales bacterium]
MTEICRIIGVLDDGKSSLNSQSLDYIRHADVVIAGKRLLEVMAGDINPDAESRDLTSQLTQISEWIIDANTNEKKVVVLATGDPLCHGIASYLINKLGHEKIEVLPNLSAHQLACAKLGLAWQICRVGSVHNQDRGEWILGADSRHSLYKALQLIRQSELTAIYTSPENSPNRIARMLQMEGLNEHYELAIAACLLQENEQVTDWMTVDEVALQSFEDLNVVLIRKYSFPPEAIFGLPDERFKQRKPDKGLITKREVRAVSLARLSLQPNSIVWDIGAGSGSVGLEAARLCPIGHVYAIEKNTDDVAIALENKKSLKVSNYSLIQGRAPAGMEPWIDPDAVFIGGSGGELQKLIILSLKRLKNNGQLVMNFVTLENLNTAMTTLKELAVQWDVVQLQASRSKPILSMNRMQAENPVWVVCATANGNSIEEVNE